MLSTILSPLLKYICGGLLFLNILTGIAWQVEKRGHAKANRRIVELTQLRAQDRTNYIAAQKAADEKNKAQVQSIESHQQKVTSDVETEYRRQLDALRLRAQSRAAPGSTGKSNPPAVPQAPGGADGSDPLRLPPEKLLRAQELELQLMYLEDWVNRQAGIDPNR